VFLAGFLALTIRPTAQAQAGVSATLIHCFPSPLGQAGIDGMTWDGTNLWIDVFGGGAYRIDPSTGGTVSSISTPAVSSRYPLGLAWDGSHLWESEAQANTIFELDPSTGGTLASFPAPGNFPTGLAFIGSNIWVTHDNNNPSGGQKQIYQMTTGGTVLQTFPTPGALPTGLAYEGTNLWMSDNGAQMIYELNTADMSVLGSFSSPGPFPNGLAWDGQHLWVDDNQSKTIYEYSVAPESGTLALVGAGAAALVTHRWRRKRRQAALSFRASRRDVRLPSEGQRSDIGFHSGSTELPQSIRSKCMPCRADSQGIAHAPCNLLDGISRFHYSDGQGMNESFPRAHAAARPALYGGSNK
jgi:hypothetical protein